MTYHRLFSHTLLAVALTSTLTSCGTPTSVNNLAKKTSDNLIDFSLGLENFKRTSGADAERRAINIARQASSIAEARLRQDRSIALASKAGRIAPVNLYKDIKTLGEEWARKEAEKKEAGESKRKSILDGQIMFESEATAFREIAGQLLELSKGDSAKSRVDFFIRFSKDVAKDLKNAKEESKTVTE